MNHPHAQIIDPNPDAPVLACTHCHATDSWNPTPAGTIDCTACSTVHAWPAFLETD